MKRYVVLVESWSVFGLAILRQPPHREWRYYRWRLLARWAVWLGNNPQGMPFLGVWARAILLGRISIK